MVVNQRVSGSRLTPEHRRLADRRGPPPRRSGPDRRRGDRRIWASPVRVERRLLVDRRFGERRAPRDRRSGVPRRNSDRRRLTPAPFTTEHLDQLRTRMGAGRTEVTCPNCEASIVVEPPTVVRGTKVWEVRCATCFHGALIADAKLARVMIVDHDAGARDNLVSVLQRAGYRTAVFAGGDAALAAYRQQPPDVILLDMSVPGAGGLNVMRQLQREFPGRNVIAMVGPRRHGAPDPLVSANRLGAVHGLRKPFTSSELLTTLDRILLKR
jgi:CheY-like chemotaxis protein